MYFNTVYILIYIQSQMQKACIYIYMTHSHTHTELKMIHMEAHIFTHNIYIYNKHIPKYYQTIMG